jgi:hypothetical protein
MAILFSLRLRHELPEQPGRAGELRGWRALGLRHSRYDTVVK